MRWILRAFVALVAAGLFTACIALYTYWPRAELSNFEEMCKAIEAVYEVPCGTLESPTIVYTKFLTEYFSSEGFTIITKPIEPYIYIFPNSPYLQTTIDHEMAHYILYALGIDDGWDVCKREEVARELSRGDDDRWDVTEKRKYGCT